jgi:diguanylate cyclase with GGDEF domain
MSRGHRPALAERLRRAGLNHCGRCTGFGANPDPHGDLEAPTPVGWWRGKAFARSWRCTMSGGPDREMIERFTCLHTLDRNQSLVATCAAVGLCHLLPRSRSFPGGQRHVGALVGDSLRKEVSQHLLSCVRQSDLAVRHVGDELAVIKGQRAREAARSWRSRRQAA